MNSFCVLMSVYFREKVGFLNAALSSIWDNQSLKPSQIVLVKDGKLTPELDEIIEKWQEKLNDILDIVELKENVGLGDALNAGLKKCKFELVARMDSDDISLPERFKKQIELFSKMPEIDVCGGNITEFVDDENNIISTRILPQNHIDLAKFAKFRSPFNHVAVVFKKSVVEKCGGYQKMLYLEDYYLWARMLVNGAKFHNINETLVNVRIDDLVSRRAGLKYAKYELSCLNAMRKIGFLSFKEFIFSASARFLLRILPKSLIQTLYKKLR